MLWTLLPSLILFGTVMAISPGPNNFLLASSGAQFGFRQSLSHLLGIRLGIIGLVVLCAAGVGVLVQNSPFAYHALKYLGVAYMSYLAVKLILAGGQFEKRVAATPLGWRQAAAFQLANVKAWASCLSVVATYTIAGEYWWSVLSIVLVYTITGFAANSSWVCLGRVAAMVLNTSGRVRCFNYSLSALTFATILPVLFQNQ